MKIPFINSGFQKVFDCNGKQLKVGQVYKIKTRCIPEIEYYVIIQPLDNSYRGCKTGLQTFIPGRHSAALHDYWSTRLEIVGDEKSHGNLLYNQTI